MDDEATRKDLLTPAMGGQESALSPAMRRWQRRMAEGYSIRPVIARSSYRGTVWRPGLFNPDGRYVRRVRLDTLRKLVQLGIVSGPEVQD